MDAGGWGVGITEAWSCTKRTETGGWIRRGIQAGAKHMPRIEDENRQPPDLKGPMGRERGLTFIVGLWGAVEGT